MGRRVKQMWHIYPNDDESGSEGKFESVEMDGTIKEYNTEFDAYDVYYAQDGTTVREEIPPRTEESEIRLIDGSGVYEEKVDELLATGKWRIWPFV